MGFNKVNFWDMCAIRHSDPELREDILAGYMTKGFHPYQALTYWPDDMESILDFGTGLGRNIPYLLKRCSGRLFVLDRPAMLVRFKQEQHRLGTDMSRIIVCDDAYGTGWSVDLVYMSLVLQHLEDPASVWMHLPRHKYLVVRGRSRHDNGGSTWATIPRGDYRIIEVMEEALPPNRWTGSTEDMFEELRAMDNERHFEVLLERRTP